MHTDIFNDVDGVAAELARMEETIIFHLLARAQHPHDPACYAGSPSPLDARLERQDLLEADLNRFASAEERPFTSLPSPAAPGGDELPIDDFNRVNLTGPLKSAYLAFLPELCPAGASRDAREVLERDTTALKILSRRIHYGSFYVAEAKYRAAAAEFRAPIERKAGEVLARMLTRVEVEARVVERVGRKTDSLQTGPRPPFPRRVEAELIASFFRESIIPLTLKGEIEYLLARRP